MSRYRTIETVRECRGCKQTFPLTEEHFQRHPSCRNGFHARCRRCIRAQNRCGDKVRRAKLAKARQYAELKPGEHCLSCEGLAHRRPLSGCPRCKLPYQAEAPVEPVLRQFGWAV